jgi:hypothetical protein
VTRARRDVAPLRIAFVANPLSGEARNLASRDFLWLGASFWRDVLCCSPENSSALGHACLNPNGVVRVSGHHGRSCSPPSLFEPLEELVGGGPASGARLTAALGPALIAQRRTVGA